MQVKDEETGTMSNVEWLDLLYPTNEDLPHIYNEYRWDHCSRYVLYYLDLRYNDRIVSLDDTHLI